MHRLHCSFFPKNSMQLQPVPFEQEDWVLCRAFHKSRGVTSKPAATEAGDDETPSSSIPPFMDKHSAFQRAPLSSEGYQQVSCFSNLSPHTALQATSARTPIAAGDEDTPSSSLPLSMEKNSTFQRAPPSSEGYQQVSCFSNRSTRTAPQATSIRTPISMEERSLQTISSPHMGGLLDLGYSDKVIHSALNHCTKTEGDPRREVPPSMAARSLGSYISGNGSSYMWNPF
ncbi:hypothetical protein GW17_00013639 [Ensete ventricosum]|nr:hypothetical protein GW17_00013639 [Ensete ventricosum]